MELDLHIPRFHRDKTATTLPIKPTPQIPTERPIQPQTSQQEELIQEYNLAASKAGLGELDAVKVDKYGNIIDGFHRTGENANWRREVLDWIDTPEKLELARLAINFARRKVTDQELTDRITVLIKSGMKPDQIANITGIHLRKIYRHIPANLKSEKSLKISQGIKEKVDKCKVQNVTSNINTHDNSPIASPALTPNISYSSKIEDNTTPKTEDIQAVANFPELTASELPKQQPVCICPHCGKPITHCTAKQPTPTTLKV